MSDGGEEKRKGEGARDDRGDGATYDREEGTRDDTGEGARDDTGEGARDEIVDSFIGEEVDDRLLSESLSVRQGLMFCEDVCLKKLLEELQVLLETRGGGVGGGRGGEASRVGGAVDDDDDDDDDDDNVQSASPVFVYSRSQIRFNVSSYRQALENQTGLNYWLGYALKVYDAGCTCLIAVSGNEVKLALSQRLFSPDHIILNGNGKYISELELAVRHGCLVNIDSPYDVTRLLDVTDRLKRSVRVLIRLNPDIDPDVHPHLATGLSKSKFGVEEKQLTELLESIQESGGRVILVGLHCHLGSTISTTQVFTECLNVMLDAVDRVRDRGFNELKYINLGGGLNIDYRKHEIKPTNNNSNSNNSNNNASSSNISTSVQRIPSPTDLLKSIDTSRLISGGLTLILEPGRSIIGSAGTLLTKVIGCKHAGSKNYITVDGSMTEVIRPAFYGAYHHIELIEEPQSTTDNKNNEQQQLQQLQEQRQQQQQQQLQQRQQQQQRTTKIMPTNLVKIKGSILEVFDVVGPVCECADFLGKDRPLRRPHVGCGLAVLDVGAYCSSMSSNYNMRPRPAEILVTGDTWRIIRRPETFNDICAKFTAGM